MIEVENGWESFREVNRVVYDPNMITIEKMEQSLKQSGTYRGTKQP